jgi:hypothetical protein
MFPHAFLRSYKTPDLLPRASRPQHKQHTKEKFLCLSFLSVSESTIFHATEPSGGIFVSHTAFETLMVKSGQNAVSPVRSNKSNGNEASSRAQPLLYKLAHSAINPHTKKESSESASREK